jgi:tetratricopeptide (TPR) repeat protein
VGDSKVDELQSRRRALEVRLNAASAVQELDALKLEIGTLFKAVDQEVNELTAIRQNVLKMIEQWKELNSISRPTVAPEPVAVATSVVPVPTRPTPSRPAVHSDHIGASTFIDKGWSRISTGDYVGAEEALNKALQLAPDDPQAESLLGWSLMLQDRLDEALSHFQKVLVGEPQNSLARVNLGYICLKKRIFGEAIEHLSRAIRLDNDKKATLYAHFYLGLVYLERDMFEDAQTFFRKALSLGPNLIEAYFELGRAYWLNNQRGEALYSWKAGAAANKFNSWGQRCAEALKSVEEGGQP